MVTVPSPDTRPLVDVEVVAAHLGVSRATVFALIHKGLPSLKVGHARRFRLHDINGWLDAQAATTSSAAA